MTNSYPTTGVARAVDAGFGVIKFTRAGTQDGDGSSALVCDSFLSVANRVDKLQTEFENGGGRRDTYLVSYDGKSFEVGKGLAKSLVANDFGRNMTDTYYDSDAYHALMRGALASINEPVITTLVLGLPMNHFENKDRVEKLRSAYTGLIDLGHGRAVTVVETVVHPQPMGGYLSLGTEIDNINEALKSYPNCGIEPLKSLADLKKINVLVVDPGEFTLDWLMMTPDGPHFSVSNAMSDAGRHRILRDVHKQLSNQLKTPLGASFITNINEALRHKKPIKVGGVAYSLDTPEFREVIQKSVEEPVEQMLNGLRGSDGFIDLVVVIGGSPTEVANEIRRKRPNLPVFVSSNLSGQGSSIFANLRGFQNLATVIDNRKS